MEITLGPLQNARYYGLGSDHHVITINGQECSIYLQHPIEQIEGALGQALEECDIPQIVLDRTYYALNGYIASAKG